jgi:hypothetical protein
LLQPLNEIERCDGVNDDDDIGGSGSEEIEDEGEDGDDV